MIEEFVSAMCRLSYKHGREWLVIDRDNDQVTFTLDNYRFTFSWEIAYKPVIGRAVPVPLFSLCAWHQTMGNRHTPPEDIDTSLVTSQSVYDCIRVAFETVAKEEIRMILENDSYEQMLKNEKEVEVM